jgi:hypothetical protein
MARKKPNDAEGLDTPQFDFSTYSHRMARATELDLARAQRLADQLNDAEAFPTEDEFENALIRYNDIVDKLEETTCRVLVSVPESWLVPGAPDYLDWSLVESLHWLRQDKYQELQRAIGEARRPENVSKNSVKR